MAQERIGRYRILENIASGTQGAVSRAFDPEANRLVAIKVLHPSFTGDATNVERFHREASLAASIAHPNIIEVYEVGEDDGRHFMAMEFLPENLARIIEAGPLSVEAAAEYAAQIGDGLGVAHAAGIVHRDIKPQNILITPDGTPKVTDFGIARAESLSTVTATGMMMGTPYYMSPEQARGERADARSDVYSLGCVLYQMLCGEVPFEATNPLAVLRQHIDEQPQPIRDRRPDVPRALAAIVEQAMAKAPAARFASAAAMAPAIREAIPPIAPAVEAPIERPTREPPPEPLPWEPVPTDPAEPTPPAPILAPPRRRSEPARRATGRSIEEAPRVRPVSRPDTRVRPTHPARIRWRRWGLATGVTAVAVAVGLALVLIRPWAAQLTPRPAPVLGTYPVGEKPYALAVAGDSIWVANSGDDTVTKLALDGEALGTYAVGTVPWGVAFDAESIWVTNRSDDTVMKLALDGEVLGTYAAGDSPSALTFDGESIWVANWSGHTVTKLTKDGRVLGTYAAGTTPTNLVFDGESVWVSNGGSMDVMKLTRDGRVLGTYDVGLPRDLAFDGENVWVATDDGTVTKLTRHGRVLDIYRVGTGAKALVFDGESLWVTNTHDAKVMKLALGGSNSAAAPTPAPDVTIPDANLAVAMREALGKPPGEAMTAAELAELTELAASDRNIADLTGIGYCASLNRPGFYGDPVC